MGAVIGSALVMAASAKHLSTWYRALGALLAAGQSLPDALAEAPSRLPRLDRTAMATALRRGQGVDDVLRDAPKWLPEYDRLLLSAAAESGRLAEACANLADHHEARAELHREVITALIYPVAVLQFAVLLFPLSAAVDLAGQFASSPGRLFAPERYAQGLLTGMAALWLPLVAFKFLHTAQPALLATLLRPFPWLGRAQRHAALARTADALDAFLRAGLPMSDAWGGAGLVSGDRQIRNRALVISAAAQRGEAPGDLLKPGQPFPASFVYAYQTGERTGSLDRTLPAQAQSWSQSAQRALRQFAFWLPKLVFLLVGLLVAASVAQAFTAYLEVLDDLLGGF